MDHLTLVKLQIALTALGTVFGIAIAVYFGLQKHWNDKAVFRQQTLKTILEHIGTKDVRDIRRAFHALSKSGFSTDIVREIYEAGKPSAINQEVDRWGPKDTINMAKIETLLVAYDRLAYAFIGNEKALDEACMVQIDTIPYLKDIGRKFITLIRNDIDRRQPHYVHDIEVLFAHFEKNEQRLLEIVRKRMCGRNQS